MVSNCRDAEPYFFWKSPLLQQNDVFVQIFGDCRVDGQFWLFMGPKSHTSKPLMIPKLEIATYLPDFEVLT
jgi:hypothetical protein